MTVADRLDITLYNFTPNLREKSLEMEVVAHCTASNELMTKCSGAQRLCWGLKASPTVGSEGYRLLCPSLMDKWCMPLNPTPPPLQPTKVTWKGSVSILPHLQMRLADWTGKQEVSSAYVNIFLPQKGSLVCALCLRWEIMSWLLICLFPPKDQNCNSTEVS